MRHTPRTGPAARLMEETDLAQQRLLGRIDVATAVRDFCATHAGDADCVPFGASPDLAVYGTAPGVVSVKAQETAALNVQVRHQGKRAARGSGDADDGYVLDVLSIARRVAAGHAVYWSRSAACLLIVARTSGAMREPAKTSNTNCVPITGGS